ncbi:MAG: hypothetical protein KDK34_17885, partial [Leptospiraceae bacterium]|nr:hypothetical protein [Leptospiraceae bacterium]
MHSSIRYLHIFFMSVGWVGLLIIAISIQVLPMFYVTREHMKFGSIRFLRSLFALTVAHALLYLLRPYVNKLEFIINSVQSSVLIFLMCAGLL